MKDGIMRKTDKIGSLPFGGDYISEEVGFITDAQNAAAMMAKRGSMKFAGDVRLVSVKLPIHLAVFIDAMAERGNTSRTNMIVALLEAGLESSFDCLSEEEQIGAYHDYMEAYNQYFLSQTGRLKEAEPDDFNK